MTLSHSVSSLRFTPCGPNDQERGLLGHLAFQHGSLSIDSVALRRTRRGRLELSYPERSCRHGMRFPIVRPINDEARLELETAILQAVFPRLVALGLEAAQ